MGLRIRPPNAIKVHVTLKTAGVLPLHVVTSRADLQVPPSPLRVATASRARSPNDPWAEIVGEGAVPYRLESPFVSIDAVTVDTELRRVTGGALSLLPYGIQRMDESIVQIVLALDDLTHPTPILGCERGHPICR